MEGAVLKETIDTLYETITKWHKNQFQAPTGQCGKKFIKLMTEWIHMFNIGSCFKAVAMKVVMVLPSLLLQKPSAKSKAKEHSKRLEERLKWWEEGKIEKIREEAEVIQKKLVGSKRSRTEEDISRIFSKLLFEGKVGPALKFLDEQAENAVLPSTQTVIKKLQELHPESHEIQPNSLIQGPLKGTPERYSIDEDQIRRAANATKGSGGPSQLDAQQ